MERTGLPENHIAQLISVFGQFPQVETVRIFGSRAKGNFHERSDLDLAVMGKNIDVKTLALLKLDMADTDLPYWIDIQLCEAIKNPALKEHIDRVGKIIYQRNS